VEIVGLMRESEKREKETSIAHRSPRAARISTEQQPATDVTDTRAHEYTSGEFSITYYAKSIRENKLQYKKNEIYNTYFALVLLQIVTFFFFFTKTN